MNYPWASPDYLLDEMTIEQVFLYYDYLNESLNGEPAGPNKNKPNRKKFHDIYGDKIKTPDRKGAK